jgi:hypothetical protein
MSEFNKKDFGADTCGLQTVYVDKNGKRKIIKSYNLWGAMFSRCYNENHLKKQPIYRGCTVCDEWKSYKNFKEWFDDNYIEGYQLDKDILVLVDGNKVYGPDFCRYIPQSLNCLLNDNRRVRGEYPQGVSLHHKSYRARLNVGGDKRIIIGTYPTADLAFAAYKKAKESRVKYEAETYFKSGAICIDMYNALMAWEVKND